MLTSKKRYLTWIIAVLIILILIVIIFIPKKVFQINNQSTKLSHGADYKSTVNWIGHWKGEGKRMALVSEVANEFEFLNQDVKVNLKFPEDVYFKGDASEIEFIAKQALSANPEWDIIRVKDYYPDVAKYLNDPEWGKKYLVDFSQFPDFVAHQQDFLFSDEYKAQNGGITIGPYNEGFFWAVWYNKEIAQKLGINIKQYGMTVEDFVSYIKATQDYNQKNNTDIIPYFEESGWLTFYNVMMELFYSEIGDINKINDANYDPKKIVAIGKVLKLFEEISTYNPLPKNRSKINWSETFDYPLSGKCLLYVQGSWMYNIWDNIDHAKINNMIPCELPSFSGTSPCYIGGYKACWAVLKNAPHYDQAVKLMKMWTNPEMSEKWVRYTRCPTGVKGNLSENTFGFDQFEDFEYNISKKFGLHLINPIDNRYIFGMKNKGITIPFIDILEKRTTAEIVMNNIRKQIK